MGLVMNPPAGWAYARDHLAPARLAAGIIELIGITGVTLKIIHQVRLLDSGLNDAIRQP